MFILKLIGIEIKVKREEFVDAVKDLFAPSSLVLFRVPSQSLTMTYVQNLTLIHPNTIAVFSSKSKECEVYNVRGGCIKSGSQVCKQYLLKVVHTGARTREITK